MRSLETVNESTNKDYDKSTKISKPTLKACIMSPPSLSWIFKCVAVAVVVVVAVVVAVAVADTTASAANKT